ncbi:MAG: CRISPR-associated endonuclease Cas3'' [Ignisphaera sp.]
MCYAYRDEGSEEPLPNHLADVASCCRERWEFAALASKISRVLNISRNDVQCAITLAALLHDIGKAAEIYQKDCASSKCTQFSGHYLISMFLVDLAFRASGIPLSSSDVISFIEDRVSDMESGDGATTEKKVLALLVLLPIAFHHYHQVRGFTSYNVYRDGDATNVGRFIESPKIWSPCIEKLDVVGQRLDSELAVCRQGTVVDWLDVLGKLRQILSNIDLYRESDLYRGSRILVENLGVAIEKNLKNVSVTLSRTVIESVVGLINLCDGYVAYRARMGRG